MTADAHYDPHSDEDVARELAAEQYRESDRFTVDAIDWVASCADLPADLIIRIEDAYRDDTACRWAEDDYYDERVSV